MKVAVVYHQFPHYRAAVLRALAEDGRHEYVFWASTDDFAGVKAFKGDAVVSVNHLRVTETRRGFSIRGLWPLLRDESIDAFIILGNPNIAATWLIAIAARASNQKVLFWTHGWLRRERWVKRAIRGLYFRLADMLLVYGNRSKTIGEGAGYPSDRIRVIYNSLDFSLASRIYAELQDENLHVYGRSFFPDATRPLLICTARLTRACSFDLLIQAARLLQDRGFPVNVLLVGDGPARAELELLAKELDVNVHFYGACYDEQTIGRLIFESDATVSPGKIGLTAMHSLSYGTPAFTHGDLDRQMPEVEAIVPGETGDFFRHGSSIDLANTLERWFKQSRSCGEVRCACRAVISERWNPVRQRELIEAALDACYEEARVDR
jgi:glycosyltransferase involved in cell wall biosynthesis